MATQDRTEAAKQGSTQALASLINATLQPKGIIASVTKKSNQLTIKLQSQNVPDQNAVMKFLKTGMQKIKPLGISQVQVQASGGGLDPCWEDSFFIIGADVSQSENGSPKKVAKTTSKSSTGLSSDTHKIKGKSEANSSFLGSKNGERIALVAGTFLATSALWLISLVAINGLNRFIASIATSEAQSDIEVSSDSNSEEGTQASGIVEEVVEEPATPPSQIFLTSYLDSITTSGSSGTMRWCSEQEILSTSFFSPRSYEIVEFRETGESANATVRIESSNKGGMPIIQNWKFFLSKGATVLERDQKENGNIEGANQTNADFQNWCISMVLD